ncbi:MAG: hypothetical protein WKH97_10445 [Casimicrobiaceae bacterium]
MAKHDWATIRKEYVEGIEQEGKITWPAMRRVAEIHEVDGTVLRLRAARERWADLRNQYKAKQLHARQTARVKTVAHAGAKFDADILRLAQSLATMLGKRLETLPPEDTEGIRKVSAALVNVQRAGRIALGEPADGPLPSGNGQLGPIVIRVVRDGAYGHTLESAALTEEKKRTCTR